MSNGKGDSRRPSAVGEAEFSARWRHAFGHVVKQVEAERTPPCPLCPLPPHLDPRHARKWKVCEKHAEPRP